MVAEPNMHQVVVTSMKLFPPMMTFVAPSRLPISGCTLLIIGRSWYSKATVSAYRAPLFTTCTATSPA